MVRYHVHEKESSETSKCYQIIYDTINKAENEELKTKLDPTSEIRKNSFSNFILYLLVSPYI